jgi:hypothetical protein
LTVKTSVKKDELEQGLRKVHCTHCGHFLGLEALTGGISVWYCKRCKVFTRLEAMGEGAKAIVEYQQPLVAT